MASDINRVFIVGRCTRDSELSYTQSGYALLKLSIATNRSRKVGDQWQDEANFFDVVIWGKRGEALAQYLQKGQQVVIEGQLKQDRWEQQDGTKRSKVTIEASDVQLVGGRGSGGGGNNYSQNNSSFTPQGNREQQSSPSPAYNPNAGTSSSSGGGSNFEDDIPF